jgi:hypothetical protein
MPVLGNLWEIGMPLPPQDFPVFLDEYDPVKEITL